MTVRDAPPVRQDWLGACDATESIVYLGKESKNSSPAAPMKLPSPPRTQTTRATVALRNLSSEKATSTSPLDKGAAVRTLAPRSDRSIVTASCSSR